MNDYHIPVMATEAVDLLKVKRGSWYVDCTLGGGGHGELILKQGGNLIGIDQDPDSINYVKEKISPFAKATGDKQNSILIHGNFADLKNLIEKNGIEKVDGVLFDLGVSTHQLLTPERGFSFNTEALLDMRMDPSTQSVTAKDLINGLAEKELAELFTKLGEENFSRPIARAIANSRRISPITTCDELARIILQVRRRNIGDRTHPATRVFQALRIAVNDELNNLRQALPQALVILKSGGRIVTISFHSLEDRIVKNFFQEEEGKNCLKIMTKKPLTPSEKESLINPRARSAKLRCAEKI